MQTSDEPTDFSAISDSALLDWRAEMRDQLASLAPQSADHVRLTFLYDASTAEVNERARTAWARTR